MLKFQTALIAILITCCVTLVACERTDSMLGPAPNDMTTGDNMSAKNVISFVPTTDVTTASVGEEIEIDVKITDGEGVAGYGAFFVFNTTALKYINTTRGDYLPAGGIWMSPELGDDGNYQVRLTVGDSTATGVLARVEVAPDAPEAAIEFSIDEVLFQIPETQLPPEFVSPGTVYLAFSILASSPLGADTNPIAVDGDGTLATLTFEVLEATPGTVHLLEVNLSDTNDETLTTTLQNSMITVNAPAAP